MTSAWRSHLGLLCRVVLIATLTLSGVTKLLGWESPLLLFARAGLGVGVAKGFGVVQVLVAGLMAWDRAARPAALVAVALFGAGVAIVVAAGATGDVPLTIALTLVALLVVIEPALGRPPRQAPSAVDPQLVMRALNGEQRVELSEGDIPLRHERGPSSEG